VNAGHLAALAFLLPLLGTALVVLCGRRPNLREAMTILTGLATFVLVASLVPRLHAGESIRMDFFEVLPGLPLAFDVEPLGLLFALVASGLWILTSCYSIGYMRAHHEEHQTRFYAFFAIAISCAIGIAFSGNVFTLFLFYEALTLSTYPLVTHHGSEAAAKAGRAYLGILVTTSVAFLFTGIVWTWIIAGTVEFRPGGILQGKTNPLTAAVLLGLYVFGTGKAAVMPFHRWLPNAMVAPTPVSALLHAVAVVKAGVFTVLKVTVYVFGIDFLRETGASAWLAWVAAATMILAGLVALTRDGLKERLAYSTISQLAYIVLGAMVAHRLGIIGGALHIVAHAFGKITLFFCAGGILVATHKTKVSELDGLGRTMPVTMSAFFLASLSVIGLPPFGGSWSKLLLAMGAVQAGHAPLAWLLLAGSLLSAAYLLPISARAFLAPPKDDHRQEAPAMCLGPICFTTAGALALFFLSNPIHRLLEGIR